MARINNAKNFKGKSYVASDEITNIINSIQLNENKISFAGAMVQDEANVGQALNIIDLEKLTAFLKTSDRVVKIEDEVVDSSTNVPTDYAVRKAINEAVEVVTSQAIGIEGGVGISVTTKEGSTTKIISTDIQLEKLSSANEGFAASYRLKTSSGETLGVPINIPKDQFLKDAKFIASATSDDQLIDENVNVGEAYIKFTFTIKTELSEADSVVYVNVNKLVDTYTAGNGIAIDENKITAKADSSDTIYTSKGVATSIITVTSDGIKVSGVQSAIDLAVNDAYAKTKSAITAVNTNVETFESAVNANVSSTVTSVNTKINSAVSSVNAQVGSAITAVNGKVDGAVTAVNGAITSTVSSVNAQVGSAITAVNGKVDGAVTAVNGAITSTVSSVNTQVKALASQVVTIVDEQITTSNSSGTVTATVSAARIIAVYDETGAQIYPEISRVIEDNSITYTLTADYGSAIISAPAWSVLCAKHNVTYTDATVVSATAPEAVTYSSATIASATAPAKVEYNNAESATDASYTSANYDNAVTVAELDYNK